MMDGEPSEGPFTSSAPPIQISPEPPAEPPAAAVVILGRFQPFHRGHAALVTAAIAHARSIHMTLRVAIGSANQPESLDNPWTSAERTVMVKSWLADEHPLVDSEVVAIPDINDPPNWVAHAEQYHGEKGVLFTSDGPTADLYRTAGWEVVVSPLEERKTWVGWRIRSTLKMLSTVDEREAALSVMAETIPDSVANLLWENGWLTRLAFLGRPFEPVG